MISYLQKLSISQSKNIQHEDRKGYDRHHHPKLFVRKAIMRVTYVDNCRCWYFCSVSVVKTIAPSFSIHQWPFILNLPSKICEKMSFQILKGFAFFSEHRNRNNRRQRPSKQSLYSVKIVPKLCWILISYIIIQYCSQITSDLLIFTTFTVH